jgi:hypothetical protein
VAKVSIFSKDESAGELLKRIAAENLPDYFGGSCSCPAEGGCSVSDTGPWKAATDEDIARGVEVLNGQVPGEKGEKGVRDADIDIVTPRSEEYVLAPEPAS